MSGTLRAVNCRRHCIQWPSMEILGFSNVGRNIACYR